MIRTAKASDIDGILKTVEAAKADMGKKALTARRNHAIVLEQLNNK